MKPAEKQRPARLGGALISTRVAARLLQELTGGRYAHDDRLPPEVELAGALQVSRTVVRDALSRAGARGVHRAGAGHRHGGEPRRGAFAGPDGPQAGIHPADHRHRPHPTH